MFFKINSLAVHGLHCHPVEVEVDTGRGLPGMVLVGLASKATLESRDRVKTALNNAQMPFPRARVTVNLAPGDLPKEGPLYDLPIALGIALCCELFKPNIDLTKHWFVGELALDGSLRPVHGILAMAQYVSKLNGTLVLPEQNLEEAQLVEGLPIVSLRNLDDLIQYFKGTLNEASKPTPLNINSNSQPTLPFPKDFKEVKGQTQAKRALEIAAAGRHNALMVGPPGSGKSMLAERLPGILPLLQPSESLEVTSIYSVAGQLKRDQPLISERPFRSPHHTISDIALIGGGSHAQPGEISLAHRGVLFLDELPEFKRSTLEVLRQPLESGTVNISRANRSNEYPARFLLIAALNPCPCGWLGSRQRQCKCSPAQVDRYMNRLSGPLLDRIDLHLEVLDQPAATLRQSSQTGVSTKEMRERVLDAHKIQQHRFKDQSVKFNGEIRGSMVDHFCQVSSSGEDFLQRAMKESSFSARAWHKILMVSRTIADIEQCEWIEIEHLAEAMNYRVLDLKLYS